MTRAREFIAVACGQVVAAGAFFIVKRLYAIRYPGNITIPLPEPGIKKCGFDLQMCLIDHSRLLVLCTFYNKFPGLICHVYLFPKENILRYN